MKQLPPPPEPPNFDLPVWVVFAVIGQAHAIMLKEVARVKAGSEASAIVSAVESGKDIADGARVAFPLEQVFPGRRRSVGYIANLEDR